MRVRLYSVDGTIPDAMGTIISLEPLYIEETGEMIDDIHPKIKTDDGEVLLGLECWWTPWELI